MMFWPDPDESNGSCAHPGIYRFTIQGGGIYVGRFTRASRPMKEYVRNVKKLVEKRDYRPQKPDGFRPIHRALFQAIEEGRAIKVEIVENADPADLNERERYWIGQVPPELRLNGRRRQT